MKKHLLLLTSIIIISFLNSGCEKDNDNKNTASWTNLASIPTARYALGFAECDGLLYAIGGYNANAMNVVEAYDPNNNTWTSKSPMPTARGYLVTATVNHKIYAIGGNWGNNSNNTTNTLVNEEYDPISNMWKTKSPLPMPSADYTSGNMFICGSAINGKIYVVVGNYSRNEPVYIYDPATDTWDNSGAPLSVFNYAPFSCATINNDLYISDGASFLRYKSDKNEWNILHPFSKHTYRWSSITSYDDKIFCFGGYTNNENYDYEKMDEDWFINLPDVSTYNTSTSVWSRFSNLRTGRCLGSAVYYNGSIYVVGGAKYYIPYPTGMTSMIPLSSLEAIKVK